jgi:RND superfamily putative drug exporter
MFAWWGALVARYRARVLGAVVLAVLAAGGWGLGVFGLVGEGGFADPDSESSRAVAAVEEALGPQGGDVVLLYTVGSGTVDDPGVGDRVEAMLGALPGDAVSTYTTYWQSRAPQLVSADRRTALAVLTIGGTDDNAKIDAYATIKDSLAVPGTGVRVAGGTAIQDAGAARSTDDLAFAEGVSLPIVLILLVVIFGSLVAAALPVLVGAGAVLGSLGVLHAIALVTDVNSFAVNVASLLGLGMAIDYGLFMVGRFREEQAAGRTPAEAVAITVATAGRTVMFSATLLTVALAGLLVFPQNFLKSLAYGGMAAVVCAAGISLTLLPAVLALLGPRVEMLPVRLRRRPRRVPAHGRPVPPAWERLAAHVMRRPVHVLVPIVALFALLAAPITQVRFGEFDERTLPAGDPHRQAAEALQRDFPALASGSIEIVLRGTGGEAPDPAAGQAYAVAVGGVPGIDQVDPTAAGGDVYVLTATPAHPDPLGTAARDAVRGIRALPAPPGTEVLVGGVTARNLDSIAATASRLPWMIALLVGATLILMFLAFGSVLLPVKAVLVSAVSLLATFGCLVWIFQLGYLADLLGVTPGPLEIGIVVLMGAVVFGLSTDYEVFLLSRMAEARAHGADTARAVTVGLARTGRVITAAALLLIVVTGAFALATISTMRFVGIGMIIALVLDATVVRMLLVPAVIRLLGDAAWWAPPALRRLQRRAGLSEAQAPDRAPSPAATNPQDPTNHRREAHDPAAHDPAAASSTQEHGGTSSGTSDATMVHPAPSVPTVRETLADATAPHGATAQDTPAHGPAFPDATTPAPASADPAGPPNQAPVSEPEQVAVEGADVSGAPEVPVEEEPKKAPGRSGRRAAKHAGGVGGFTYGTGRVDWEGLDKQGADGERTDKPKRHTPSHLRR